MGFGADLELPFPINWEKKVLELDENLHDALFILLWPPMFTMFLPVYHFF
jgi:hypothetical protein